MKRIHLIFLLPIGLISLFAFTFNQKESSEIKSYLALGDSYTICESIDETQRWPIQLVNKMNQNEYNFESPEIIAKTGWRTDDLLKAMENRLTSKKYDLVSVLIGVNNEFQGRTTGPYKKDLREILSTAIERCKTGKNGVFIVSIPDYGYTSYGKTNQKSISSRIDEYNKACKEIADDYQIPFYNITPISRKGLLNSDLVALDGLHPSAIQYGEWIESFYPQVTQLIP